MYLCDLNAVATLGAHVFCAQLLSTAHFKIQYCIQVCYSSVGLLLRKFPVPTKLFPEIITFSFSMFFFCNLSPLLK